MIVLAWINLLLAFLLELLALTILGYWGFHLAAGDVERWIFGLGAPTLFLTAWSVWAAPKVPGRLAGWKLWVYKVIVFSLAALALGACGPVERVVVFETVVLVNLALLRVWRRFEPSSRSK